MDPIIGGALIGGGAALIGGHLSDRSNQEAAAANAAAQERFAKEGITWRVADAKRAGISPEFALGASTASFAPTYTGSNKGDMIADAGQNVARAVLAQASAEDRKFDELIKAQTLRGMTLDNDMKATQMTSVNKPGNPPFPSMRGNVIEGQGNSPVKDVSLERTGMSKSAPHSEGGSIPTVGWGMTQDGGLMPIPSQDVKNRIEDQLIPEVVWAGQNLVGPNFGKGQKPPKEALPPGFTEWRWSLSRQAFYPSKGKQGNKFSEYFKSRGKELMNEYNKYYKGKYPLSGRPR